eukprot:gene14396-19327_t
MGCNSSSIAPNNEDNRTISLTDKNCRKTIIAKETQRNDNPSPGSTELISGLIFCDAPSQSENINIFAAIKKNDTESVKNIIRENSLAIMQLGMWSSTPLIVAIQYGCMDIIVFILDYLLISIADPSQNETTIEYINHRNEKGTCALLYAVMEGYVSIVDILLSKLYAKVDVEPTLDLIYNNYSDESIICTPISIAVTNGRLEILKSLLQRSSAPLSPLLPFIHNQKPSSNQNNSKNTNLSLLMLGALYNQPLVVRELLYNNCDISIVDQYNNTLLHYISRTKFVNPNKNTIHSSNNNSNNDNYDDGKEESDLINEELSPMSSPGIIMLKEIQKQSLLTEIIIMICNNDGETALHVACENKRIDITRFYLENEHMNPSIPNTLTGMTPLHIAIKRRSLELASLLLDYGADPLQKNNQLLSSYDMANKLNKNTDLYKLIITSGEAWLSLRTKPSTDNNNETFYENSNDSGAGNGYDNTHNNNVNNSNNNNVNNYSESVEIIPFKSFHTLSSLALHRSLPVDSIDSISSSVERLILSPKKSINSIPSIPSNGSGKESFQRKSFLSQKSNSIKTIKNDNYNVKKSLQMATDIYSDNTVPHNYTDSIVSTDNNNKSSLSNITRLSKISHHNDDISILNNDNDSININSVQEYDDIIAINHANNRDVSFISWNNDDTSVEMINFDDDDDDNNSLVDSKLEAMILGKKINNTNNNNNNNNNNAQEDGFPMADAQTKNNNIINPNNSNNNNNNNIYFTPQKDKRNNNDNNNDNLLMSVTPSYNNKTISVHNNDINSNSSSNSNNKIKKFITPVEPSVPRNNSNNNNLIKNPRKYKINSKPHNGR